MTIFICAVGGSPEPVITAFSALTPTHTVFLCTGPDPASGNLGSLAEIVGQSSDKLQNKLTLSESDFSTLVIPADDLIRAQASICAELARLRQIYPHERIVADYTGGTKTMSAALVMAAIDADGVELQITTGARLNTKKVSHGQSARSVPINLLRARQALKTALQSWSRHAYDEAAEQIAALPALDDFSAERDRAQALSEAFAAWDRFDHAAAANILLHYPNYRKAMSNAGKHELFTQLENLADCPPGERAKHQHEPRRILDLWRNAERRAAQGRWDDAVARVYRLVEWTAQWQLRTRCNIDTANLDATSLPDGMRITPTAAGKLQCGLMSAWEILCHHQPQSALAQFFIEEKNCLRDHLSKRNHSILAHGLLPVDSASWSALHDWANDKLIPAILRDANMRHAPPQLPVAYE